MIIRDDVQLDYCDVLILPQTTTLNSRAEPKIEREFRFKYPKIKLVGFPLMQSNMTQMGNPEVAYTLVNNGCFATLHKFLPTNTIIEYFQRQDLENEENTFVTVGIRNFEDEIKRLREIYTATSARYQILLDVPNAYIPKVHDAVKRLRDSFPEKVIAVGNVATGDETQRLINDGADIVKVGIGPSKVCLTRSQTGVGRPQLSAVIECANAAHQVGGHIIADGGFETNGDFAKALCAGADFLMSGAKFAGTDEASGNIIEKNYFTDEVAYPLVGETLRHKIETKKFKEYYGMSSNRAMVENYGKVVPHASSEGVEGKLVPYVGPTQNVINDIKGAIRSTCTYVGAKKLKDLPRQAIFVKVQRQK